jgi:hypothetical protein
MKNFKVVLLALLVLVTLSCNEKDDSTVVGDAIVVAKKSGNDTVYAMAYYAYAYTSLKSVTVHAMVNSFPATALAANGNYTTNFIKEPEDEDFTNTKPSADTFVFKAVFESGKTYETEDDISSDILGLPVIETCIFNADKSYAEISWTALTNADSYVITVYNASNSIVFRSGEFANTVTSTTISASTSGWETGFPVSKGSYKVRIQAFKYEDSTNPNSYHIQSTSYSEASLVWG